MKKLLKMAPLFFVLTLMQIVAMPAAQAAPPAPGDFLFLWGSQQHFKSPVAIAADGNGEVFVADIDRVHAFNKSGGLIRTWGRFGSGDGQFSYPGGIAVDKTGKIYVADTGNFRIQVFDSKGNFLRKWGYQGWGNGGRAPVSIAIGRNGNVYVVEGGAGGAIIVFDTEGNFLRVFGSPGTGAGQYSGANAVAVDAAGDVYVVDNGRSRVQIFAPNGMFIKVAVGFGYGITGISVGDGKIYLAAGAPETRAVFVYDRDGNFLNELVFHEEIVYIHYWEPIGVAVDGKGNVFALTMEDGFRAFDSSGNVLEQWWAYGTAAGQLSFPTGIAVAGNGNVLETDSFSPVAEVSDNRVQLFTGQGKSLGKWTIADIAITNGIAIDGQGDVYVLEGQSISPGQPEASSTAFVFDSAGNFLRKIGAYGSEEGATIDPMGVAFDKNGNIVVSDTGNSRVQILNSAGQFVRLLGGSGTGNGEFADPQGVAVDSSGNIFAIDAGNSRVQVFDSAYNFVTKWGSEGSANGEFFHPAGIAVDGAGHVFVADAGNNRIQVFDSTGHFLRKWGGPGDDAGLFNQPRGIAISKGGDKVYVADTGNNRIQVFRGYGSAASFSVTGTVHEGEGGTALAGATVTVGGKSAVTSSTGAFTITGIPAGTYTVVISKAGYVTRTVTDFVLQGDMSGLVYFLASVPTYSISGKVVYGSGSTGRFLPGATVSIAGKTATTGSNGAFSIAGIPAGSYTLTISKSGYATRTMPGYVIAGNRSGLVFGLYPAK